MVNSMVVGICDMEDSITKLYLNYWSILYSQKSPRLSPEMPLKVLVTKALLADFGVSHSGGRKEVVEYIDGVYLT